MRSSTRKIAALTLGLVAVLAVTSCGGSSGAKPTTSANAGQLPPVMIDPASTTSAEVPMGNTLVLNVETPGDWTAELADSGILKFQPGGDMGTWVANPAFVPIAPGKTEVTVHGPNSATYVITVTVTKK